jgi:hypothetical protein
MYVVELGYLYTPNAEIVSYDRKCRFLLQFRDEIMVYGLALSIVKSKIKEDRERKYRARIHRILRSPGIDSVSLCSLPDRYN